MSRMSLWKEKYEGTNRTVERKTYTCTGGFSGSASPLKIWGAPDPCRILHTPLALRLDINELVYSFDRGTPNVR